MAPRLHLSSRPSIREIAASILTSSSTSTCAHRIQPFHRSISSHSKTTSSVLGISARPRNQHCAFAGTRSFHAAPPLNSSPPPRSRDRGPVSSETTQTDFSSLDVLGNIPVPSTAIDACLWDGFHLNNGVKVGAGAGVLLVAGEAFEWRPWEGTQSLPASANPTQQRDESKFLINRKGQWEVPDSAWGVLALVHPKPDLLILGLGPKMAPLSPATRKAIAALGIRVEVQDTRNASAQFNLLATERGVSSVAAGLVPVGWREGKGVVSSSKG